jgi:hypothetical protein
MEKRIKQMEYFEEVETTEAHNGYFFSVRWASVGRGKQVPTIGGANNRDTGFPMWFGEHEENASMVHKRACKRIFRETIQYSIHTLLLLVFMLI